MHDSCSPLKDPIRQGDTWLSNEIPKILGSPAYQNGGAVFIVWDEAENGDGPIGMIVISQFAKGGGYSNTTHYTHGSTLRTLEEIFGVPLGLRHRRNRSPEPPSRFQPRSVARMRPFSSLGSLLDTWDWRRPTSPFLV